MTIRSLKKGIKIARNMGPRYVAFRILHAFKARSGLLRWKFPANPPHKTFISLQEWRDLAMRFFFDDRRSITGVATNVAGDFERLKSGIIPFFSSLDYSLGPQYDWLTNPDTGFRYPGTLHWTKVNDFDKRAGDIKFVWEKSRFTFLYTAIRYDAYTGEDNSGWVFAEIVSWIKENPINCGPNYVCSQEISLRVLNWTFALNFYKNSSALTDEVFQNILHSIYWQLRHVYENINFSRIAVRNNHAIAETLALYLGGLFYPFFPEAKRWKVKGKNWFEEEIAYQIYDDGTFLQFSLNYQRVVVQLLTWAIRLSELNEEKLKEVVYLRAEKCLYFLTQCMDPAVGWLPNYGANDGALFFPLSSAHFRDYRPQLEALSLSLGLEWKYGKFEDAQWYGRSKKMAERKIGVETGSHCFEKGGFYLFRLNNSLTFIRCGNHKDRPAQADNLHIDVWYNGMNLLHDAGSYKYNADDKTLKYFAGTASHNTVMLSGYDQMEKGDRFIWYDWTQCEEVAVSEAEEYYLFSGTIKAFQHVDTDIRHVRVVRVYKNAPVWEIEDKVLNKPATLNMCQLWHTQFPDQLMIKGTTSNGRQLTPTIDQGSVSHLYGKRETCTEIAFSLEEDYICTRISVVE